MTAAHPVPARALPLLKRVSPSALREGFVVFLFAVGILCGNFTLARVYPPLSVFPDILFEVRYLSLVILAMLLVYGKERFDLTIYRQHPIAGFIVGALGAYLAYHGIAAAFIWEPTGDYSYLMAPTYLLIYAALAPIIIRDRARLVLFAHVALGTICTIILFVFILGGFSIFSLEKSLLGSLGSFTRLCFIGFALGIFLFAETLRDRGPRIKAAFMLVVAALFIFSGLLTYQRISLIFYAVTIGIMCMFSLARRDYLVAAAVVSVLLAGYAGTYSALKDSMFTRLVYHAQIKDAAQEIETVSAQCRETIGNILKDHPAAKRASADSCEDRVTLSDRDGRLRMLKHGLGPLDSKWFGNGPGRYMFVQFSPLIGNVYIYNYPHNIFLSAWYDSGIIGLAALFFALSGAVILALRIFMYADNATMTLLSLPLFYLFSSMVSGEIYDARLVWLLPLSLLPGLPLTKTGGR